MNNISVIIPIYNAERYLSRCIDSILEQSYTNFEIILVNDGSSDNSAKICDSYSNNHSNIHVIHKTNGGVTAARRDGVLNSTGRWITFVDSDDTLPSNSLEYLINKATAQDYDIVAGAWRKIYPSYRRLIPLCSHGSYSSGRYIKQLLHENCYRGPVGKLFKRELFDKDTFNLSREIVINEDLFMNIKLGLKASKCFVMSNRVVYNYFFTENSASSLGIRKNNWDLLFSSILSLSNDESYKESCIRYIITSLLIIKDVVDVTNLSYFKLIRSKYSSYHLIDKLLSKDLFNPNCITSFFVKLYNFRYFSIKLSQILLEKISLFYK